MRNRRSLRAAVVLLCAFAAFGQQPSDGTGKKPSVVASAGMPAEKPSFAPFPEKVAALLESKIKSEWEAIKKRDKEAFNKLITDDFIQVESDGDGARNRYKAANELAYASIVDYHLQLFKGYSLSPTVAYVRYENTMQLPLKGAARFKRIWISEIWVQQGADWKLWRYQETPVR